MDTPKDNVTILDVVTTLDCPPDRILSSALDKLNGCVIIGFDKEDNFYFSSSIADGGEVIWLLELAKKKLLEIGDA